MSLISIFPSPSTRTFTVPSGNFSNCNILANVPTLKRSFISGSSTSAFFCVIRTISLDESIALFKAIIDFSLPTNNGITMLGNTTTSRNDIAGIRLLLSLSLIS